MSSICDPQTEFVATFLGTANLMVGGGHRRWRAAGAGPVSAQHAGASRRTARGGCRCSSAPRTWRCATRARTARCPVLGQAVVEQRSFVGSFERLRLRLPPLPGVRAIAPPVPFGRDEVWSRPPARRTRRGGSRSRPGDSTWVGVRGVHALVHPGLRFLLLTGFSEGGVREIAVGPGAGRRDRPPGSRAGRRARPRPRWTTPASAPLQEAREALGSGLAALETRLTAGKPAEAVAEEVFRRPCDLVILSLPPRDGDRDGRGRARGRPASPPAHAGHGRARPAGPACRRGC